MLETSAANGSLTRRREPEPRGGGGSIVQTLLEVSKTPDGLARMIGAAFCLALLAGVFWTTLEHFIHVWSTDDNYSHGFLVPFISLYFADVALRKGPIARSGGLWFGVLLLCCGMLAKLATIAVPVGVIGDLAFLAALSGVCSLLLGTGGLKRFSFAIAFLVFMIPLPVALYSAIANPLQLMVSNVASNLLNGLGIPVLREGNTMTLPGGVKMFVAEACSGLRQLTGFLALTTALAHLSNRPLWHKTVVLLSAVPIAMFANIVRVLCTGLIMHLINPRYASGSYHTLEGLLMMGLGLAILGLESAALTAFGSIRIGSRAVTTSTAAARTAAA
jgi:exosortase